MTSIYDLVRDVSGYSDLTDTQIDNWITRLKYVFLNDVSIYTSSSLSRNTKIGTRVYELSAYRPIDITFDDAIDYSDVKITYSSSGVETSISTPFTYDLENNRITFSEDPPSTSLTIYYWPMRERTFEVHKLAFAYLVAYHHHRSVVGKTPRYVKIDKFVVREEIPGYSFLTNYRSLVSRIRLSGLVTSGEPQGVGDYLYPRGVEE